MTCIFFFTGCYPYPQLQTQRASAYRAEVCTGGIAKTPPENFFGKYPLSPCNDISFYESLAKAFFEALF